MECGWVRPRAAHCCRVGRWVKAWQRKVDGGREGKCGEEGRGGMRERMRG